MAMLSLSTYQVGFVTAQLFFCAWLFPLGWLVLRSGSLSRLLGWLLLLDGIAVLIWFLQTLLAPSWTAPLDAFSGEIVRPARRSPAAEGGQSRCGRPRTSCPPALSGSCLPSSADRGHRDADRARDNGNHGNDADHVVLRGT